MFLFLNNIIQRNFYSLLTWIIIIFLFHLLFKIWYSIKWLIHQFWVNWSVRIFWCIWRLSHCLERWILLIYSIDFIWALCDMKWFFNILRLVFFLSNFCQWWFKLRRKKLNIVFPWFKSKSILVLILRLAFFFFLIIFVLFTRQKSQIFPWIFISIWSSYKLVIESI